MVGAERESSKMMEKKYELVAPDGGWGYLIAISAIISFSTTTAFVGTFGMIYDDFMKEISMSSAGVTLLMGIFGVSSSFAGFLTSALLTLMSVRWLAFITAVIFAFGTFGTVIMTSTVTFLLSAGIFQGVGFGIMFNLSCTIMNDYFVEHRVLIMSFVQTATGINAMVAPIFVKWSQEQYGSKGTLLLIGGISLHNFIAVLLMQPVKWHMKKIEVPETTELKLLLEGSNDIKKLDTPIIKLADMEGNPMKEDLAATLDCPESYEKKSAIRKILNSFIDTSLINTFLFSWASLGPCLCCIADGLYMVMVPQYLYSIGWSQENVALALTLYGFGDLAMRVIFTIVSKWMVKLGVQQIYIVGAVLAVLSRLGMLWTGSIIGTMVSFTLVGVAHCSIAVLVPLVIADAVAPEKFTSALGIGFLLNGIMSIVVGPAIGAIRDFTNSYPNAFYTLISFYALVAVLWPIELIVKNKKRRKAANISKSSQLN